MSSHTPRPEKGNITFHTGDLKELVTSLKEQQGKNIYCDGGAEIVNQLLKDNLIDDITISVIPVLLGGGILLFSPGRDQSLLTFSKLQVI